MPKNKVQEVIFTILMVFVMVYAMICYNIAIETGSMTNMVFLHAFRELPIMGPIAFLLDFFLVGGLAKKAASKTDMLCNIFCKFIYFCIVLGVLRQSYITVRLCIYYTIEYAVLIPHRLCHIW